MEEKELKELLQQRLHMELLLFRDSILQKEKGDIFRASYKTEIFVNLYEILAAHTENLQSGAIRGLMKIHYGILEAVYQEWLKREDSFYDELKAFACKEMENISDTGNKEYGKEKEDGKEPDQTAQGR